MGSVHQGVNMEGSICMNGGSSVYAPIDHGEMSKKRVTTAESEYFNPRQRNKQ